MKKIYFNLLLVISIVPVSSFAQTLGTTKGNTLEISSINGTTQSNNFWNKIWLYRSRNGTDWLSTTLHNGISIDGSYLSPNVDTKTWWERDPYYDIQSWGNANKTYVTIYQGNLGIGTTTPSEHLSVNSGVNATQTRNLANSITIGAKNANASSRYLGQFGFVSNDENFSAPKMVAYISGEAAETYTDDTKTASVLKFFTGSISGSNPSERMIIDHKGDVGIGTTVPNAKLAVNGNIRAKEIKVENANWPDYVFAKEYQLPSLKETERYVKEKGHLPGIPSAAEVQKNGVNLGDMNAKLLQKLEEVTLYLIDQNKKIEKLQKQNNTLQAEIEKIKKKHN